MKLSGVTHYALREYFGVGFVALLLGLTSGRWDWPAGWSLVGVYFGWVTATILVIAPRHPALLADRAQRSHPNTRRWDRVIMALFGVETLARYGLAGLDVRFGWTVGFPCWAQLAGGLASVLGFALVIWAMAANPWFSTVVRLQGERGHQVASGGPYAWVRHPGYVGTCCFEVGTGALLGSWPAVVSGGLGLVLMIVRTALEDRMLRAELAGYARYAQQVRWRLLPLVW